MSPEEIARRHEELPGFELVDYAEVALPLWQLSVEAISVAHKRLPPISEFTLRALNAGLKVEELSGFLGLTDEVLDGALAQLLADRLVRQRSAEADVSSVVPELSITEDGVRALDEDGISLPIEEQFVILFDGIRRTPTAIPAEQIAFPREAASGALVEISATPPSKPQVADLRIEDVERVLVQQFGDRVEFGRTLLRLKRISRHRRLFRKAVALVFKSTSTSKELRIKLVVGGIREEALEHGFAESGGLARPGIIRAFSDSYLDANLRKHMGTEISKAMLDGETSVAEQRALSIAKLKLSGIRRKLKTLDGDDGSASLHPLRNEAARVEADVRGAELALENHIVRRASVYEQMELLDRALNDAGKRLLLSSQGLSTAIADKSFFAALRSRLNKGVEVEVRLDRLTYERSIANATYASPYIELGKIADQFRNLTVTLWKEARYFHLAVDDELLLVSNRPLLSFHTRIRTFDQYSGYFIRSSSLIGAYLDRVRRLP